MNIENILTTIKKYNFTEYEAKIYVALLQKHPLNGNEIAILSGVPSPKVYESLKKLGDRMIVFPVSEGSASSKKSYVPLPYKELLQTMESKFAEDTALLSGYFQGLAEQKDVNWSELYHINGFAPSIDALRELIHEANVNIYISCWKDELKALYPELLDAFKRGVTIVSITFDSVETDIPWKHYSHHPGELSAERHIGELSCALDDQKVFILHSSEEEAHSIISSHFALTRTTINYIRHDIYINRVVQDLQEELKKKYGDNFEEMLNLF